MIDPLGFTILAMAAGWFHGESTKKVPPEKKRKGWISRKVHWEMHIIDDSFGYDELTKEEQSQVNTLIYIISDDWTRSEMDGYRLDNHLTTYNEMLNKVKGLPLDSKITYTKDEIKQATQTLYSMVYYKPYSGHLKGMTKEEVLLGELKNYRDMHLTEDIEFCDVVRESMDEERIYKGLVPFKEMLEKENVKPQVKKEKNLFDYAEDDDLSSLEPIKEIGEKNIDDTDDDLSWLSQDFKPGKIVHHINKE